MGKLIWLSYSLDQDTPAYGGGTGFSVEPVKSIASGDSCNTALWSFPNHIGTHIDTAKHFYEQGPPVDSYEPSFWLFHEICLVEVALPGKGEIIDERLVLPLAHGAPELLLIKTGMCLRRSERAYWESNPGLSPGLGRELKKRFPSLRAVGIDTVSISSWQNRELGREAHRAFLNPAQERTLILIEDMDLAGVNRGTIFKNIVVLPLRVTGADGAPCSILAEIATQ